MKKEASFNVSVFVQRALIITFIIALIEVPVVYFWASYEMKPKSSATSTTSANANKPVDNRASVLSGSKPDVPSSVIVVDSSVAVALTPTVTNKPDTAAKTRVKKVDTTAKMVLQKIDTMPAAKKLAGVQILSEERMAQILDAVNSERMRTNVAGKCVKIRKAANSNISNAFSIADYLKAKGFIISGREDIAKQQQGYAVVVSGDCMIVTIGAY